MTSEKPGNQDELTKDELFEFIFMIGRDQEIQPIKPVISTDARDVFARVVSFDREPDPYDSLFLQIRLGETLLLIQKVLDSAGVKKNLCSHEKITPEQAEAISNELREAVGRVVSAEDEPAFDDVSFLQSRMGEVLLLTQNIFSSLGLREKIYFQEEVAARTGVLGKIAPEISALRDIVSDGIDTVFYEKSSELEAFMKVLKERYETNEHNIPCHSEADWSEIDFMLNQNPAKLEALKRMDDSGGEPDVIRIDEGTFVFADLSASAPNGRRKVNYEQAVSLSSQFGGGCKLMAPDDYLMIWEQLRIKMDKYPDWTWLDSSDATPVIGTENALYGYQNKYGNKIETSVGWQSADTRIFSGSFRCILYI